ncbi:MAG TPA: PAS domain-containing protein [Gaiellaceae bacterium]|nr:PAS domain-containing protein [Gaiellaceae bacterium]
MADESRQLLTSPHVQATLLAETVQTAEVGLLVWDDDRHYVAANAAACALLGCTLEELLESVVGDRTVEGQEVVDQVVRERGGRGRVTFERFDGGQATVEYLTFATRTAGMPHMASVIWPAEEDASS